jgi:hypothetical protein
MADNFDRFPSNIGEILGRIPRQSFSFAYTRFEVWQGGALIYSDNSIGVIDANVLDDNLNVSINDNKINKYVISNFSFGEISTNGDRIMWSKDIFNTSDNVEKYNPDISSLFYQNGILKKVTYTIHDPNILVEFYS